MDQLILSDGTLVSSKRERIEEVFPIRLNGEVLMICIRQGRQLLGYKYETQAASWRHQWTETVFDQEGDYPVDRYPWLISNRLIQDENILLLRHPNGIQFYRLNSAKPGLTLLGEDIKFNEFFSGDLIWGHFLPETNYVGVMTRDANKRVTFYATTLAPNSKSPLSRLKINVPFPTWIADGVDFFVTNLRRNGSELITLRTRQGLEFYQFNSDYSLEIVMKTSLIAKSDTEKDHLYFVDLTHQIYRDIVHLDGDGLFVYQYSNDQNNYKLLHHHNEFTRAYGWLPQYENSIQFADLNGDSYDDLLFTGPNGIKALSFDPFTNNWKPLLNSKLSSGAQRYATTVGVLPAMPPILWHPSIFMQDSEGKIQWAKIIPAPTTTTTTILPVTRTSTESPVHQVDVVPKKAIDTNIPEKPILRWVEQWDDSFIKNAVDPASGQVRMNIPLVDIFPSTGWRLGLTLTYNSQLGTSDLVGTGWSLPLAEDYIVVDYRGSIYFDDAHYYLIAQGHSHRLKLIANDKGVQRFKLAEEAKNVEMTIEFQQSEQRWIIEGTSERTVYGKADRKPAQDALQWSLGWPNWRGIGRDKSSQQSLITAWYLNMRHDKHNQRTLFYHYQKDSAAIDGGKPYDVVLRLKTINDDHQMRIDLDYAPKNISEYNPPNPIDKEGNIIFQTPFDQSHYLQGYSISTADYSQTIKFLYQVNDGKRLLTSIQQQLPLHSESILNFSYQTVLDRYLLQSCAFLPKEITVTFNYQSLAPPEPKLVDRYPIRERAKIVYGSDFVVMAYRDLNPITGKVLLRIMNRSMSQTIVDCSLDAEFSCPSAESEIKDFVIQAYQNSFIVSAESTQNQVLYIFDRFEQSWSKKPITYKFSKQALIRFGETVIAAAEPDKNNLRLFTREDNQSGNWNEKELILSRGITALVLHNKLIVGYDDYQLWLFRHNAEAGWNKQLLETKSNSIPQTFELFDLDIETRQRVVKTLTQNSLQILNNIILLNILRENNGQLSSHSSLFLLDSRYNIVHRQSFEIWRERIAEIVYEHKDDDSTYKIGYVKDQGRFKARIKAISGKIIDSLITAYKITNANIKEDFKDGTDSRVRGHIDQLNQADGWKGFFKKALLINSNLYTAQMNQQGVYVGNDTLLRFTGVEWTKEPIPLTQSIQLGKHFILETDNGNRSLKIYKQNGGGDKLGQPIQELQMHAPGQSINGYPAYIAYHPEPNLVKVLTFKDERTLGEFYTLNNEQLLPETNLHNLITVTNTPVGTMAHTEPQECRVRPVSTLLPPKVQSFVNQMILATSDTQQLTAYERSFIYDQNSLVYNETVAVIPGNNKNEYGWYESTRSYHKGEITKSERWFNAGGERVSGPPEEPTKQPTNTTTDQPNPMQLLDRSGKWLVSDFSPYSLVDEMVAYYGFEPYENNQIGVPVPNAKEKTWSINRAQIIKGNFAFTGEHHLQLNSTSFFEGKLQPLDQKTIYIATCWIRSSTKITLNQPLSYLKAIVNTSNGQKVVGLRAQAKRRLGDWFYLELILNFQVLRKIYRDFVDYNKSISSNHTLPPPEDISFQIILRVEAPAGQTVDLDHIRFTPITHDFQAAVYNPLIGKPTAVIQANGLVVRTIYNRLQQEIASTDEKDQLQEFSSSSRTGKLVLAPRGSVIDSKPNTLTFEPEYGSYETFDSNAWISRWKIDSSTGWHVAPGQLWHEQSEFHQIEARSHLFDGTSAAIRFYFTLRESQSTLSLYWQGVGSLEMTRQSNPSTNMILPNGHSITSLPPVGELIIMFDQNYFWLWLDGVLLVDQAFPSSSFSPWSSFALKAKGKVVVEDFLVMNRPQVTINYFNAFSEKMQIIQLEDATTAQVSEILYDPLGRAAITTKTTRIKRNEGQSLLAFRPNFAENKNPNHPQSVWRTGVLRGEIDSLNPSDHGFAYTRTEYALNPLNQEQTLGLSGSDFSISGRYAVKINDRSNLAFLDNLFPVNQGYRQKVERVPNGTIRVSVFDKSNNQVAKYVHVSSYNHLLSTYEYDSENRLIKILPPLYHEKVNTASRLSVWRFGEENLSSEEKQWQNVFASRFHYDGHGRLIRKITPDSGITEYLYNNAGQKRFMVSLDANNQSQKIVYFNYDINNQLISTGRLNRPLPLTVLHQYLERRDLPHAKEYQAFDYANDYFDPQSRGRLNQYITNNDDITVVEKIQFDAQQQIMSKNTVLSQIGSDPISNIEKEYLHNRLKKLIYPVTIDDQPLNLIHNYNRLGQLVGLGTSNNPTFYASFTYLATGQLASEQYQPGTLNSFTRNYHYNSPGFLDEIADPFLIEDIDYTNKGYGQPGYGDGMIMQTTFNAIWPSNADGRWFQIRENDLGGNYSATCVKALKRTGYLTDGGQPIKLYIRDSETSLPLVCGGETARRMAKLIAQKQKPNYYGHRYAYGNHRELVKAKYFIDYDEVFSSPLQPNSFATKIPELTNRQSQHIWQLLTNAGYIVTDQQRNDPATAVGKPGESFFRSKDLHDDLAALSDKYTLYVEPIERLVISAIGRQKTLSLSDFKAAFLHWQDLDLTSPRGVYTWQEEIANQIGQMLLDKGYLPAQSTDFTRPLNNNFTAVLQEYAEFIPNIVQTLSHYFTHAIGQTAFDTESYKIDANGNHHLFYTGFDRYELEYRQGTNQISRIKLDWDIGSEWKKFYTMKHDAHGNVIQALHKNIQLIEYHPVSARATRIKLTDGRTLRFSYDAQGERILKRVFDPTGEMSSETQYIRDEKGRVLMDRRSVRLNDSTQNIVTAYIYGPRGLIGFIRNNNFYSVTTDHAGSVRLVIKNGRVVSAYDYLPYGELMRSYGNDPQASIMYRYTGQEWDEETGLYNYHARLYDPSIGRFYQPDPKSQYFSPYKYAGNSPISVVDPDGELALLLICITLGLLGAYLGGAAANNRWNPIDWDYKDSGTWIGIVGGGIAGGLAPIGAVASVTFIGGLAGGSVLVGTIGTVSFGLVGAYLTTAAANGKWDLSQWTWDRPNTWSALFQGFSGGASIMGGIGITHSFANGGKAVMFLNKLKILRAIGIGQRAIKGVFLTVSYATGGSVAYASASIINGGNLNFWEWDWSNPATWAGLVDGFDVGMGWPQNIMEMGRGASRLIKNPKKYLFSGQKSLKLKSILKDSNHPLYKTTTSVVMAYYMGSAANGDFDIANWNLAVFSTYEGVLNGVFFGKDITKTLRYIRESNVKQLPDAVGSVTKQKVNIWPRKVGNMLEFIQESQMGKKYQQLVEKTFTTSAIWLKKLSDQSPSMKNQVDNFVKKGFKEWKSGKNRPPRELQQLLLDEASLKTQEDTELTQWKIESNEASIKKREIFPDEEDGKFLKCKNIRRRKRADGTNSNRFSLINIEEDYNGRRPTINIDVNIDGREETMRPKELYKYIEENYSEMMMPDKHKFLSEHQKFINDGYVLIGYHGTNEIAALSIILNGFKPSKFPPIYLPSIDSSLLNPFTFDPDNYDPSSLEKNPSHWDGVYVAEDLKMAINEYATSIEYAITGEGKKDHARVLAVYAKKENIQNVGMTEGDINDQFDIGRPAYDLNRDSGSIISGKDTSVNRNEVVIKKDIELKAAILPIVTEKDFQAVEHFLELKENAQKAIESGRTREVDVKDIKSFFDSDGFSENDYKSIIGHFWTNKNDLLGAIEYAKAMHAVTEFKKLSSNDLTKAKTILGFPDDFNLSVAGFQGMKKYFSEQNLIDSADDLNSVRILLNAGNDNVKNILLSNDDSSAALKTILDTEIAHSKGIKSLSKNSKIPLENVLYYSLGDAAEGGAEIFYYCPSKRRRRSIETIYGNEVENYEYALIDQDMVNNDTIDSNWPLLEINLLEPEPFIEQSFTKLINDQSQHSPSDTLPNVPSLDNSYAHVSSASKLEFWPISLFKKAGRIALSILTNPKEIGHGDHLKINVPQSEPFIEQQSMNDQSFDALPILQMGDHLIKNVDANGLLLWGTILARKWTGYRQKFSKVQSYNHETNIILNIMSRELVDAFMDSVLGHAQTCGIGKLVSIVLENPNIYEEAIQTAHKQFQSSIKVDDILRLLYDKIVQENITHVASKSAPDRVDQFLMDIRKDLPKIKERFEQQNYFQEERLDHFTQQTDTLLNQTIGNMRQGNRLAYSNNISSIDNIHTINNYFINN